MVVRIDFAQLFVDSSGPLTVTVFPSSDCFVVVGEAIATAHPMAMAAISPKAMYSVTRRRGDREAEGAALEMPQSLYTRGGFRY
jgi:hypothetical protein